MVLCGVQYWASVWCYAMSSTEVAYAAMGRLGAALRGRGTHPYAMSVGSSDTGRVNVELSATTGYALCSYALSGTELAYAPTRCLVLNYALSAIPDTGMAYAATHVLCVLSQDVVLCLHYGDGTELGYGATRFP
eukprot:2541183-Rhodomonas_salina.1